MPQINMVDIHIDDDCTVKVGVVSTLVTGRRRFVTLAVEVDGRDPEPIWITADEAEQVAAALTRMADEVRGRR